MAGDLFVPPSKALDANANPYSGAKWFFYASGTTTPQTVFATSELTVAHANPVVADSSGKFPPVYFKNSLSYRGVLQDATGAVTLYDLDPINTSRTGGSNANDFGLSTAATASQNLSNLQDAVDATDTGGALVIPVGNTFYSMDTTGGFSAAVQIDRAMTIVLEGDLKSTFGAIQANPPAIFNVTADNVTIEGSGKLIGSGSVDAVNAGTDDTIPSLVRVTGANFTMRGITIDTPYKSGVMLYGCFNALIENCRFTGGPTSYTDTGYFGVRMSNIGGRHTFRGNRFYPSATGGMYVQCIFSNGASDCTFENNFAYRPYEKLVYLSGDGHDVKNNYVIGNTGTIPGTNQTGTIGEAYRLSGAKNKLTNNRSQYGGGATLRTGGGHLVMGNQFLDCGQSGISMIGSTGVLDNSKISGNLVTCGNLAGVLVTHGINVATGTGTNRRVDISGNTVVGFGIADALANIAAWTLNTTYPTVSTVKPTVGNGRYYFTYGGGTSGATEPTWPTTPGATVVDGTVTWTCAAYETLNAAINMDGSLGQFDACTVADNNTSGGYYALKTTGLNASKVSDNLFGALTVGVLETTGGTNRYIDNFVSGAATEKSGLAATSLWTGYVTGTFNPVISDGTNNATMGAAGSNTCKYTRQGDVVTVTGNVASTALGSVTGAVRITGLPYSAASGAGGNSGFSVGYAGGLAITANQAVTGLIQSGQNYIDLYLWDGTGGPSALQATEWTDDGNMSFTITYHAAP